MLLRILVTFFLLLIAGCTGRATDTELRDILVPGYDTPSSVLYARGDTDTCRAISKRSLEISDSPDKHEPFMGGYFQVRASTDRTNYRAFFKPERIAAAPYEAAFIFCTNDSTPISINCSVIGVIPGGCFETGYSWYKLSEIESLINLILSNAPKWRPSAAPNNSFKPNPHQGGA